MTKPVPGSKKKSASDEWDTGWDPQKLHPSQRPHFGLDKEGWIECKICSKKCASLEVVEDHIQSKAHVKKMQWLLWGATFWTDMDNSRRVVNTSVMSVLISKYFK